MVLAALRPHRIVTRSRDATHIDTLTYWRGPLGRELEVPERFTLRPDGWDVDTAASEASEDEDAPPPMGWRVDITLPFGLAQRDVFTLMPDGQGGTLVRIDVDIWCRTRLGRLALGPFKRYARKQYPRTWRAAARWCESATPA